MRFWETQKPPEPEPDANLLGPVAQQIAIQAAGVVVGFAIVALLVLLIYLLYCLGLRVLWLLSLLGTALKDLVCFGTDLLVKLGRVATGIIVLLTIGATLWIYSQTPTLGTAELLVEFYKHLKSWTLLLQQQQQQLKWGV
jgi:hypothetical protein